MRDSLSTVAAKALLTSRLIEDTEKGPGNATEPATSKTPPPPPPPRILNLRLAKKTGDAWQETLGPHRSVLDIFCCARTCQGPTARL